MIHNITLDQYIEIKEDIEVGFCVFLLDNEMPDIDSERSWITASFIDFYLIRMTDSDFKSMDIGVHPKTFAIKDGKEVKEINGFPPEEVIRSVYESIEY